MSNGAWLHARRAAAAQKSDVDGSGSSCGICPWSDSAQSAGYPSCWHSALVQTAVLGSHSRPHPGAGYHMNEAPPALPTSVTNRE